MKTKLFRKIVETHGRASLLLLATAYCLLVTAPAFAQTPNLYVCADQGYTIKSVPGKEADGLSPLSYTWQESVDGGNSYTEMPGQTAESLTVPPGTRAAGTYAYMRRVASADCPEGVPTKPYTVVVLAPATPTIVASTATVCQGPDVVFTASGDAGSTFTWTVVEGTAGTPSGADNSTYTLAAPATGTYQVQASASVTYDISGQPKTCTSATSTAIATRALTEGTLDGLKAPTHAASDTMWTFGSSTLVWSDRIAIPECHKEDFTSSTVNPSCRSYNHNGTQRYYYNWPYVYHYGEALCPAPWRVPNDSDLDALVEATTKDLLRAAWGWGGYAVYDDMKDTSDRAFYWSSVATGTIYADSMGYTANYYFTGDASQNYGYQVRCVN